MNWETGRSEKAKVRKAVLSSSRTHKVALFFPGPQLCCVRTALNLGSIDTSTYIVAVEKDKKHAEKIRDSLLDMGFSPSNIYVHAHKLSSLDLGNALNGRRLSFAFFDFCGPVTNSLITWFANNLTATNVDADAELAFTYNTCGRGGPSCSFVESALTKSPNSKDIQIRAELSVGRASRSIVKKTDGERHNARKILQVCATAGSLVEFNPQVTFAKGYRDTVSMLTFRLSLTKATRNTSSSHVLKDMVNMAKWSRLRSPLFQHLSNRSPDNLTTGNKAHWVTDAKKGKQPPWMTNDEWSKCILNPEYDNFVAARLRLADFSRITEEEKMKQETADKEKEIERLTDLLSKASSKRDNMSKDERVELIRVYNDDSTVNTFTTVEQACAVTGLSYSAVLSRLRKTKPDKEGRMWAREFGLPPDHGYVDAVMFAHGTNLGVVIGDIEDVKAYHGDDPSYFYEAKKVIRIPKGFKEYKEVYEAGRRLQEMISDGSEEEIEKVFI